MRSLARFARRHNLISHRVYAFDFWGTLTDHPEIRQIARDYYSRGHEVHIVSAISPGLDMDSDHAYTQILDQIGVPFTAIHRTDHVPAQKVAVLKKIKADCFWDDTPAYVKAAAEAGFTCILV